MITPLSNIAKFFAGKTPLPSGAVPLASESESPIACVCLMPNGRWIRWWPATRSLESMPPETQRGVMGAIIGQLGGTAPAAAEKLDVSARTVEAWRSGKSPLPIKVAYAISEVLNVAPNAPERNESQ